MRRGEAFCKLRRKAQSPSSGFTLVELLVVIAIMAMLLSIAAPRYFGAVDKAKEAVLRTDLRVMRDAIDKYRGDVGTYPDSLKSLVDGRYLREIPIDPIAESNEWITLPHPDGSTQGVYDVRSPAQGKARDGSPFASW